MDDGLIYVAGVVGVLLLLEIVSRGRGCLGGIARLILKLWRIVVILFIAVALLQFAGIL